MTIGTFIPCTAPVIRRSRIHGWIVQENGCHIWTGMLSHNGYGRVGVLGRIRRAHVVRYEYEVGPVAPGLQLDHLCRNRACGNPAHLEPVTPQENCRRGVRNQNARKTHCKYGHQLSGDNLKIRRSGTYLYRICQTCRREYARAYQRRAS